MTGSRKMPWDGVANKKHPKHRHNMMICVPTTFRRLFETKRHTKTKSNQVRHFVSLPGGQQLLSALFFFQALD